MLGIVEILAGGTAFCRLRGLTSGARPTMEFPADLVGLTVRKHLSGGLERVILHALVPELVVLSYLTETGGRPVTRALREKMPGCLVLFPDGIRIVPPMMASILEIAEASARNLQPGCVLLWRQHGVFASEENPDKAVALVETIEIAAGMNRTVVSMNRRVEPISTEFLRHLADQVAHIMVCRPEGLDDH